MKPLKFQWALGLGVNIPVIILIALNIYISTYLLEKILINEAINVRLERNYKWTYFSLIQAHSLLPVNVYKTIKQDYYKEFPNIRIFRSEKIEEFYGKVDVVPFDKNIDKVYKSESKEVVVDKEKKVIYGYYPVKAETSCLICHYNVSKNSILGVIYIAIPLKEVLETINKTRFLIALFGLIGIIVISIVLYILYMRIGHRNIEKIRESLNKITEGDLLFNIDPALLNRKDILGDLATNLEKLQTYLTNFTSKILDFSLKLTKQVDKVYHSIDFAQNNIKNLSINLDTIEMKSDNLFRLVSEISRTLIRFNESVRNLEKSLTQSLNNDSQKVDLNTHLNQIEKINNDTLELIEKLEKTINQEDEFFDQISKTKDIVMNFKELFIQINHAVYESLIISTYLKNIVASIRVEGIEEKLFDIFETDLDRYLLRIESHLMEIEKLDPNRWSDPLSISLGKWMETEEYKAFKNYVKDFDFDEFERNYRELFNLGREIIIAYDREDFLRVDKSLKEFRALYLLLKGYITEIKSLYLEFKGTEG